MKLINLIEEDFTNYKKPGMFLGFPFCSGKCNPKDALPICQNQQLHSAKLIDISAEEIITRYYNNPIPRCLIFGGLEPFDTFTAMIEVIDALHNCSSFLPYTVKKTNPDGYATVDDADIVVYTGYYPWEIETQLYKLAEHDPYENILIKFGRYLPGHKPHPDRNLGVYLVSDNQFSLWLHQLVK